MPLSAEFGNFGTLADGTNQDEYCIFCFKDGNFTNPNQTLAEMIQSSIDFMTKEFGISVEKAEEMSSSVIPTLRRWNK